MKIVAIVFIVTLLICTPLAGCEQEQVTPTVTESVTEPEETTFIEIPPVDRESIIPAGQVKMTPEMDLLPPVLHSDEYEEPVPMPYPINTAGAEDSGFIMPDGNTFYVCRRSSMTAQPVSICLKS
jgi:hypothetical protein